MYAVYTAFTHVIKSRFSVHGNHPEGRLFKVGNWRFRRDSYGVILWCDFSTCIIRDRGRGVAFRIQWCDV
jgi:hypothetical protein